MNCSITSIFYSPIKSLSFENLRMCKIKKKIGILNDRSFAFTRNVDLETAKLIEKFPNKRNINNFLSLKNSPILNKYSFNLQKNKLTLCKNNKELYSIFVDKYDQHFLMCDKLLDLENTLSKKIFFLNNKLHPFYDTTNSGNVLNSISLINLSSISDFEKKVDQKIEFERFRGNLYVSNIDPWVERTWVNKIIRINNTSFKVEKHIPRCSATNLKPTTDNVTINLPLALKKHYNHIDMGVYIIPLENGEINIGDQVILDG